MPPLNLMITIGVSLIVVLVVLIFLLPDEAARKKKKQEKVLPPEVIEKQEAIDGLESYSKNLKKDLEKMQQQQRKIQRELMVERERNVKLQERILQEKEWLAKEKGLMGKRDQELYEVKQGLMKAQQEAEREFAAKLKTETLCNNLKQDMSALNDEKKQLLGQVSGLEAEVERFKKEMTRLRVDHEELKKKTDEASWVSKAEYERIGKLLQEKEKELERVRRA